MADLARSKIAEVPAVDRAAVGAAGMLLWWYSG